MTGSAKQSILMLTNEWIGMLRALKIACTFGFVGLVIFLSCWIVWSSSDFQECVKDYGQSDSSAQRLERGVSVFVTPIPTYRHCIGAYVTDKNAVITALGTVVIAVFTTILGIFTMSLARSTRVAADAAKQSAEALPSLERAHIFVVPSLMWLRKQVPGENGSAVTPTFNNKAFFNCKFVNHGKTPAIIKSVEVNIDLLAAPPDNRTHSPTIRLRSEAVLESKEEWSPEEAHSIDEGAFVRVFDEAGLKSLKEGRVLLWFYGGIVYEDIFGTEHCTRFRWSYAGGSSRFSASGSKPYNERA